MRQAPGNGTHTPAALPLFYKSVVPLHSGAHRSLALSEGVDLGFTAQATAIPVTAEEFAIAQASYPIVFSTSDTPAPVALVGVPGGKNQFVEADGTWRRGAYVPAYVRRYPFILARVAPEAAETGLCFDAQSGFFASDGEKRLFEGGETTELARNALRFCADFDASMRRTVAFVEKIQALGLLADAKAEIHRSTKPVAAVGGFKTVSEEKLRGLKGEECAGLVKDGALGLVYAHIFSLRHVESLFAGM